MRLSRIDVEEYVRYAERLSDDLEVCLQDLKFRESGGRLHLAVDFSEIHAFLLPDKLPDDWLWPGLVEEMKGVIEHSALSEVLTGPLKSVLLPPYFVEFQNFLADQRAASQMRVLEQTDRAFDELDRLMQLSLAQDMTSLALRIEREHYHPSANELQKVVAFFQEHASNLVSIVRREVLYPLERAKAFLQTSPFDALDSIAPVQLTGSEREVSDRFSRLRRIRRGERDGATFMDALALEYVRRANKELMRRKEQACVLLVSRSAALRRLVADETNDGIWPRDLHVLRHPRAFAPLAWHARRTPGEVQPQLEETQASINLCSRSARLRLVGNWEVLEQSRADRDLASQISTLKDHICDLTQMGGGINESRVVIRKDAPSEHEVLRLLAMLRNRGEVLDAVAGSMAEINTRVDRAHELMGVLFHIEHAIGGELDVQRTARGVRTVIPRMGRLPYALRFSTSRFVHMLDELQRKGQESEITQEDVRDLVVRATQETADHYETLLFMAYVLGLLGQYELANRYCARALQSAERHHREDRQEALFFRAVCTRILASDPEPFAAALSDLDGLSGGHADARFVAEQGNIRYRWYEFARSDPRWQRSAPSLSEAAEWLDRAAAAAGDDRRLLASVQNSICYAWTSEYEHTRSDDAKRRANHALAALIETLYAIEAQVEYWPLRIKDTLVRGFLTLDGAAFDGDLLRRLVKGMKTDLESETYAGDRAELRSRLRQYETALAAKLRNTGTKR